MHVQIIFILTLQLSVQLIDANAHENKIYIILDHFAFCPHSYCQVLNPISEWPCTVIGVQRQKILKHLQTAAYSL